MAGPMTWAIRTLLAPILRPLTRIIIGVIAIPLVRTIRTKFVRTRAWDAELEKDIDQWFRASLVLLFATKNMELIIGHWLSLKYDFQLDHWYILAGRLLLAVGVVESMPDQELFSIIHPGPPPLEWKRERGWQNISEQAWPFIRGLLYQHLNRSSPVLAILAVIFDGVEGWVFYGLAIAQYLFIGLVTSRDRALDVLAEFDKQVAIQRQEIIEEFVMDDEEAMDETERDTHAVRREELSDCDVEHRS